MPCAFCGEGDRWIKTCRTKDNLIRVCDPCWDVLSPWLVIVPGNEVVTARCEGCGAYFNPREVAECSPGGRKDAYSGTCRTCAEEGVTFRLETPNSVT
jgi:flavoprotein